MTDSIIRLFRLASGLMFVLVVGLPASQADEMSYPVSVAVAADGTIYVADQNAPAVWQVKDGKLEKFFEASPKNRTPLNRVRCLALDQEGRLLAGDTSTREIYRFDESGQLVPLTNGGIGMPRSIVVLPDGNLLVADQEAHCIWKVPGAGGDCELFAEVAGLIAICRDQEGNVWATSGPRQDLCKVTADGQVENVVASAAIEFPQEVAVDENQNVYVADNYTRTIWKIPPSRKPEKFVTGDPLSKPVGVTWAHGALFVTDAAAKAVFQVDATGKLTQVTP